MSGWRRLHRRVPVGDRVAFHIDDVFWQSKVMHYGNRDRGERLVDFEPLDVTNRPTGALQGLFDGRNGTDAEHARLDSSNAPAHQTAQGLNLVLLGPPTFCQKHRRRARIEPRCVSGGYHPVLTKGRLKLGKTFGCCFRTIVYCL